MTIITPTTPLENKIYDIKDLIVGEIYDYYYNDHILGAGIIYLNYFEKENGIYFFDINKNKKIVWNLDKIKSILENPSYYHSYFIKVY